MARKKVENAATEILRNLQEAGGVGVPEKSGPEEKAVAKAGRRGVFSSVDRAESGTSRVAGRVQSTKELKLKNEELAQEVESLSLAVDTAAREMPVTKSVVRFKRRWVPTDLIDVSPKNRRIQELLNPASVADILPSIEGSNQQEPALLRPKGNGRFELADGSRRLFVAKHLQRDLLADVGDIPDEDMESLSAIANLAKKLSDYEEAMYYQSLLDEGVFSSWNQLGAELGVYKAKQTRCKALAELDIHFIKAFADPNEISGPMAVDLRQMASANEAVHKSLFDKAGELAAEKEQRLARGEELLEPQMVMASFRAAAKAVKDRSAVSPTPRAPLYYRDESGARTLKHSVSRDKKSVKLELRGFSKSEAAELVDAITKAAKLTKAPGEK